MSFSFCWPVDLAVNVSWPSCLLCLLCLTCMVVLIVGVTANWRLGSCIQVVWILGLDMGEGLMPLLVRAEGVVELGSRRFNGLLAISLLFFRGRSVMLSN